jgi:sec-independent protein translocase protein TatA
MGHWFEILIILALALLVFGPKRMIEMGSSLGKAFRELRNAAKEMDWSSLTGQNETTTTTTTPSPPAQSRYKATPPLDAPVATMPPPPEEQVVEGSLVETSDGAKDTVNDAGTAVAEAPGEPAEQTRPTAGEPPDATATEATKQPS